MCVNCENEGIGRRDLMRFAAAGVVALGLGGDVRPGARGRRRADRALARGRARGAQIGQ